MKPIESIEKTDESITLRDLRAALAVARHGGVARAARVLGYAQATVSAQLRAAEEGLGVELFVRAGRRLALTAAGEIFAAESHNVFEAVERLQRRVRSAEGSMVRIVASEAVATYRLPEIIRQFEKRYPRITVSMTIGGVRESREQVEAGRVNLAIIAKPQSSSRCTFEHLYEESMILLVPASHRYAGRASVNLDELAGERLLLSDEACMYRTLLLAAIAESDVDIALKASFGRVTTLPFGVAKGLGIAVIPKTMADFVPKNTVAVALKKPAISFEIGILRAKSDVNTDAKHLCAALRSALAST